MIRIRNTRTGRTTQAKDGADAALMTKIELDRRSGLAAALSGPVIQTERQREADMHAANRVHREAIAS